MAQRRYYRRSSKAQQKKKGGVKTKKDYFEPRIDPGLKSVFSKIGVPEPGPFEPDPFQIEALNHIKECDVLVSAPTGAGKTWIASQIIKYCLHKDMRVWYASPLKALSNSIYHEFCSEFGPQYCGILTGDRKENNDAPVIVGTTEILRNQLYDAMHHGTSIRMDLVILDEAHYLSDPDRGVVWEEVLIYLPSRVKLLLLSATISNAEEVCAWLKKIRKTPNRVVLAEGRPVPLEMLFIAPDGLMVPLGGEKGLHSKVKKYLASKDSRRRGRQSQIDFGNVIACLKEFNLLPAIFFLKSKKDCDLALETCTHARQKGQEKNRLAEELKAYLKEYPHLEGHRQIKPLLERRVASHHGGQLPYWKVLVERMMNRGGLDAIFSTSTVAAGVNFPARTVVLVQSDRFNGHEFADLTATDLHQMIGRAGRRGMDYIGFALIIPGVYQKPELIHKLKDSPPEPIHSQIHINFSMTLNLLLSHSPLEIKVLVERSFAAFQERGRDDSLVMRWEHMVSELSNNLTGGKCDISDPYEVFDNIAKRSDLQKKIKKSKRSVHYGRSVDGLTRYLEPGRLFLHKNGNIYAVFKMVEDQGRSLAMAHNIKKSARSRKQKFRPRRIDLNQIVDVFDDVVDIPDNYTPESLDHLFRAIAINDLELVDVNEINLKAENGQDKRLEIDQIEQQFRSMPCEACDHLNACHDTAKSPLRKRLLDISSVGEQMAGTGGDLWLSFKRRLRFLKETGFVDEFDRLTPDGYWASKLRLNQPLVIAEAIRKGALDDVSPEIMVGGLAPFVWDRTQEVVLKTKWSFDLSELEGVFYRIIEQIQELRTLKKRRGFDNPQIMFWPAAALYMWAKGVPWDQLLTFIPVDEGGMASLVMRTADHLRQVVNLEETHPQLASVAKDAIELILREPVYIE